MEQNINQNNPRPSVGLGAYIINKEGKVLLGKRKGLLAPNEYAAPGGHLEFGESFEESLKKEVKEETGLEIGKIELLNVDNVLRYIKSINKHYVTLSFLAEYIGGTPTVKEADKCESWDWYSLNNLPAPLAEFAEGPLTKLKQKNYARY